MREVGGVSPTPRVGDPLARAWLELSQTRGGSSLAQACAVEAQSAGQRPVQQLLLQAYTITLYVYARFYTAVLLSFTDPSSTRTRFEGVTSHKTQVTHLAGGRFRWPAAGGV